MAGYVGLAGSGGVGHGGVELDACHGHSCGASEGNHVGMRWREEAVNTD
jgi:hypothetical protein